MRRNKNLSEKVKQAYQSLTKKARTAAGVAFLLGLSCSITPSVELPSPAEIIAQPVVCHKNMPIKSPEEVSEMTDDELKKYLGKLIEHGEANFVAKNYNEAIKYLNEAISMGYLNDAGKALAYWNLSMACYALGDNRGEDFFTDFLIVAEDIIDMRSKVRFFVDQEGNDFVDRFDLEKRMRQAQLFLDSSWAEKVPYFGRSLEYPIPVEDKSEINFFLKLINKCFELPSWPVNNLVGNLYHVVLDCDEGYDEFYFELKESNKE